MERRQCAEAIEKAAQIVQQLTAFEKAVEAVLQSRIQVLMIAPDLVVKAAAISRRFGLLTNDALTVALMEENKLTAIASHDDDFDRVPTLTRYAPC